MIDREAERPARQAHAPFPQEPLRLGEQCGEHRVIVDRVDEAKKAARVTELCLMRRIDRRDDTADRFAVSERDKWLDDVLAHERRPPPIEESCGTLRGTGSTQRGLTDCARRPARDEGRDPSPVVDRNDLQLAHPAVRRAQRRQRARSTAANSCAIDLNRRRDVLGSRARCSGKTRAAQAVRNRRSDDRLDVDVPFEKPLAQRDGADRVAGHDAE